MVEDGEGADAIGVVVAEETDALLIRDGVQGAIDGLCHAGEGERIGNRTFAQVEEVVSPGGVADAIAEEGVGDGIVVQWARAGRDRRGVNPDEIRHGAAFREESGGAVGTNA